MKMHTVDWIEANNVWLRYAAEGEGETTIVLVHEMGGTLDSWDEIVPKLSHKYRVLRYDMRGFGLSQKIAGDFTLDDAIGDLEGFIDAMAPQGPVVLAGCAVGAGVSICVTARRPKQVKALFAFAPATELTPDRVQHARLAPQRMAEFGMRRLIDESIAPSSYPEVLRNSPERLRRFRAQQASTDPKAFLATINMLIEGSYQPYFSKITSPTWVVAGEYDNVRPPAIVEPVAAQIPTAEFLVFPSGHYMPVQTPDLISDLIKNKLDFLGL